SLKSTHPCPRARGLRKLERAVRERIAYRPPASPAATPIGDTRGRSPGSRAGGIPPADRLPAPATGAVAHVIRLISVTVAGAAPGLDESSPDFPFFRSAVRGQGPWPPTLEQTPHETCSLPAPPRPRQEPRGRGAWHDRRQRGHRGPQFPLPAAAAQRRGRMGRLPVRRPAGAGARR